MLQMQNIVEHREFRCPGIMLKDFTRNIPDHCWDKKSQDCPYRTNIDQHLITCFVHHSFYRVGEDACLQKTQCIVGDTHTYDRVGRLREYKV